MVNGSLTGIAYPLAGSTLPVLFGRTRPAGILAIIHALLDTSSPTPSTALLSAEEANARLRMIFVDGPIGQALAGIGAACR